MESTRAKCSLNKFSKLRGKKGAKICWANNIGLHMDNVFNGEGNKKSAQEMDDESISSVVDSDEGLDHICLGVSETPITIKSEPNKHTCKVQVHKKKKSINTVLLFPSNDVALGANGTKKLKKKGKKGTAVKGKGTETMGLEARRAAIKVGKRPLGEVNVNDYLQVSDSFSDSRIKNMNRSIIRAEPFIIANKIWEVGKKNLFGCKQ